MKVIICDSCENVVEPSKLHVIDIRHVYRNEDNSGTEVEGTSIELCEDCYRSVGSKIHKFLNEMEDSSND